MWIEILMAYGLMTAYFFLFVILLSLSDKEVSEKERYATAIGLALIWPITMGMVIVWEIKDKDE